MIDQNICRLDVSVHDIGRMNKIERAKAVVHNCNNVALVEFYIFYFVQELLQVTVRGFHHDENEVHLVDVFRCYHIQDFCCELVVFHL
jgi:hypothetical protein